MRRSTVDRISVACVCIGSNSTHDVTDSDFIFFILCAASFYLLSVCASVPLAQRLENFNIRNSQRPYITDDRVRERT